jgi:hypothetical protein
MRNDYGYLFSGPEPIPGSTLRAGGYSDPVVTDDDRRAYAARLAQTRAELRRARRGELTLVYALASIVALTMLPVLIVVAAAWGAVALRRHVLGRVTTTWRGGARKPVRFYDLWFAARVLAGAGRMVFRPRARLRELLPTMEPRGVTSQWTY